MNYLLIFYFPFLFFFFDDALISFIVITTQSALTGKLSLKVLKQCLISKQKYR